MRTKVARLIKARGYDLIGLQGKSVESLKSRFSSLFVVLSTAAQMALSETYADWHRGLHDSQHGLTTTRVARQVLYSAPFFSIISIFYRAHQNALEEKKNPMYESISASLLRLDDLILRGKTCSASSVLAAPSATPRGGINYLFRYFICLTSWR